MVICARSKHVVLIENFRVRAHRMTVLARLRRMCSDFATITDISHLMAPFAVSLRVCLQPRWGALMLFE